MQPDQGPSHGIILLHATLIGLTPLVPVPILDDVAKGYLQRRLVRELASARALRLDDAAVAALADDPDGRWLTDLVRTVALFPLKLILRTAFLVLAGKKMVDLASDCYHRGLLLDHAFAMGWCAPAGGRTPAEVRAAVDAVCLEINTSPVEQALRAGFERSRGLVKDAAELYRKALLRMAGRPPAVEVAVAVEAVAVEDAGGLMDIVAQLRRALSEVPSAHYDDLRRRLAARLA